MRWNLWLSFQLSSVYTLLVGVCSYNLGQNGWKIKTTPSPISMMEKMARFRCSASTSLNWGEGCFYFLFYSVQDCRSYTESVSSIDRALFDNLVFSGLISIDRQMIDQRALFDNLVVSGSIWSVRKDLELDLILFILKSSRKRLTFNPRAKQLHTTG